MLYHISPFVPYWRESSHQWLALFVKRAHARVCVGVEDTPVDHPPTHTHTKEGTLPSLVTACEWIAVYLLKKPVG